MHLLKRLVPSYELIHINIFSSYSLTPPFLYFILIHRRVYSQRGFISYWSTGECTHRDALFHTDPQESVLTERLYCILSSVCQMMLFYNLFQWCLKCKILCDFYSNGGLCKYKYFVLMRRHTQVYLWLPRSEPPYIPNPNLTPGYKCAGVRESHNPRPVWELTRMLSGHVFNLITTVFW